MKRFGLALLALTALHGTGHADGIIPRGLGHPAGGAAHWYESGCCSKQDCEPVEPGAIVLTPDGYRVRYLTSRGFIAEGLVKDGTGAVRPSQDRQEHACASPARVICIYVHFGA